MASRKCILLTILMLCFIFIGFFFLSLHQLRPPLKNLIKSKSRHKKPVDTASLTLNRAMLKKLYKDVKLKPIKSRGATIFVDGTGTIQVPPIYILDIMEPRDLEEQYDRYFGNIQTICTRMLHMGTLGSGGYDVCEDIEVKRTDKVKGKSKTCLMYSFVSRDVDLSFEHAVADIYKCEVHVFVTAQGDDLIQKTSSTIDIHYITQNTNGNYGNIEEFKTSLNHRKENMWSFSNRPVQSYQLVTWVYSISNGGTENQDSPGGVLVLCIPITDNRISGSQQERVEMLKLDIKGNEWPTLSELVLGSTLQEIGQLFVRFHSMAEDSSENPDSSVDHRSSLEYRRHLEVLGLLYKRGFRIFHHHRVGEMNCIFTDDFNISRTGCHEVSMVKIKT